MKVRSWSKPHTFQFAFRMLSADHLNIDGPPLPVKCVRKFRFALGGEVEHRGVCTSRTVKLTKKAYMEKNPAKMKLTLVYIRGSNEWPATFQH